MRACFSGQLGSFFLKRNIHTSPQNFETGNFKISYIVINRELFGKRKVGHAIQENFMICILKHEHYPMGYTFYNRQEVFS